MIPVDNSVAGRVADVHHLLPRGGLHIIGEHFVRVNHHLLGVQGATLETVRRSRATSTRSASAASSSAPAATGPASRPTRPGPPRTSPRAGDPTRAAIASRLAGEIYGLEILKSDIEDAEHNTTRFLVLAREPRHPGPTDGPVITTFTFRVRNRPAALYKALGGFADQRRQHDQARELLSTAPSPRPHFYADIMGHPAARQRPPGASRSCASSPTTSRSWASTPPTPSASG